MTEQHRIVFTPSGKRGDFAEGTSVLEAARSLGVDVDSVCGGRGICGRCQVLVAEGDFAKHGIQSTADHLTEWNSVEERYTSKRGALGEHRRLGCQAKLCGDVVIDVPPESQVHRQVVRKKAETRAITLEPVVRLYFVEVAEPDIDSPSSDYTRLVEALKTQWNIDASMPDLAVLRGLQ
ncbi:MAG: drug:proton antiporter, partial [Alphaproteobacteria bacterium]|nr:drug:proton antiporter [Alphaproteobacteria bacterium]